MFCSVYDKFAHKHTRLGKMKNLIFLWASLYMYYKGELTMITINLNMVILIKKFTLGMN